MCVVSPLVKCLLVFQQGLVLSATCVLLITRLQGQLTEGLDVVDYLMEQPNVVPRMNPLVLSTERQYLDFTANPGDQWRCIIWLFFVFFYPRSDPCFFLLAPSLQFSVNGRMPQCSPMWT